MELLGTWLISYRIVDTSSGATVSIRDRGIELNGPTPASATVDAVFEVSRSEETILSVQKGWLNRATGEVRRINTNPVLAASLDNTRTYDDSPVTRAVSADALIGEGLGAARMDARRLALAFYYPGFHRDTFESGRWSARPVSF